MENLHGWALRDAGLPCATARDDGDRGVMDTELDISVPLPPKRRWECRLAIQSGSRATPQPQREDEREVEL